MHDRPKAVAFDVDPDSLTALREAFPEWEIETIAGATSGSLARDGNAPAADLLVVGARDSVAETLGLCRALRGQAARTQTPLLVLRAPGQEALASAALDAGAHSCLLLPVHTGSLLGTLARALAGNRPARHTLRTDGVQRADSWRDDGGEA